MVYLDCFKTNDHKNCLNPCVLEKKIQNKCIFISDYDQTATQAILLGIS